MNETKITSEVVAQHGFTPAEYEKVLAIMGRTPTITELGIFSVMWSEHCSYKSSRVHLGRLPTTGERVIVPPGENAGVVDIGDDWCVAFKVESHNHPSFIEPFQGAATGVGGILRDVFTMGARPIALMNSLRFGPLSAPSSVADLSVPSALADDLENTQVLKANQPPADAGGADISPIDKSNNDKSHIYRRNKSILKGCVDGIAHYGNCFGTATVGGEVVFDESYSLNPLVNAFALGIVRKDQIFFGKAEGIGNPLLYVGAKTGRDGIHGATMASAEFDEEALEKRPTVQVGDPFLEKLLLEACLEAMRSGAIAGIQDMGAAGLTSSSVEMASRAGTGLEIDLTLVPQRETGMTAYEMMLSESQERMLIVAKSGREKQVVDIFKKWDLDAVVIGKVVEGQHLKVFHNGVLEAEIPVDTVTDAAPKYNRLMSAPENKEKENEQSSLDSNRSNSHIADNVRRSFVRRKFEEEKGRVNESEALKMLLQSPNICSKRWVYEQYDTMVRTNTAILPGADAAVVRVKETRRAISMCLDGNGKFAAINPKMGAKLIVAEAARNNVCVGAKPIAVTNCLNFASPERPEVMWSFSEVVDGISEACRAFETPVISGNVSFYNETDGRGILPTPTIGMVGLIEDTRKIITQGFKMQGDIIAILGETKDDLAASQYAQTILSLTTDELIENGELPTLDLDLEVKVQQTLLNLAENLLVNSAHDCSDGGLAVAIAEQCFSSLNNPASGAEIKLSNDKNLSAEAILFGETPSRIIITFKPENAEKVKEIVGGCPFEIIGKVSGEKLEIKIEDSAGVSAQIVELESAWKNSLENRLK